MKAYKGFSVGLDIKPNTWYILLSGEFVETDE